MTFGAASNAFGAWQSESSWRRSCLWKFSTISALLVVPLVAVTILIAYSRAERIATKLAAFLLLGIGVQIIMTGMLEGLAPVIRS